MIFALLMAACSVPGSESTGTLPRLTPYSTKTHTAQVPAVVETAAVTTPTPAVTATPQIHIVGLGETISSIAFQYSVSIDALLLANPEIDPRVMIVGDEVLIPAADLQIPDATAINYAEQIRFNEGRCVHSGGGLFCSVLIENTSAVDLEFPVISFKFLDETGKVLLEKRTPAALQRFNSKAMMPAYIFLEEVPANYAALAISLFTINEADLNDEVLSVTVENKSIAIGQFSAVVSGEMKITGDNDSDRADLTIVVAALDESGSVVGVRRQDLVVALNESFEFNIVVYSADGSISDVTLFTEAY